MKNLKRVATLLLVLAMIGSTLVGCSSKDSSDTPTITWLTTGDSAAEVIGEDDRIVEYISEKLGVNLEVTYVAEGNVEAVNVAMATGDMPDLVTGTYGSAATQSWIDDGLVISLNDYLEDNASVKASIDADYSWTNIDGEYYGVPFITQLKAANGLIIMRGDWLEAVGMEYPKTLDEMTAVLEAFTHNDPDGNGIDDTVGFAPSKVINDNTVLDWAFYGSGLEHSDYALADDGTVIAKFETQAWADGMQYLQDLYTAGLIDTEFMLNDTAAMEEKFYNGTAGAIKPALYRHITRHENSLAAIYPEGTVAYDLPPAGADGSFGCNEQGKNGLLTCVTTTSENPDKALAVIDFLMSEEGINLVRNGIEGTHYTEEDGVITYNLEEREKDAFSADGWCHALAWGSLSWPLDANYLPEGTADADKIKETVSLATEAQKTNLINKVTDKEIELGDALDDVYVEYFLKMLLNETTVEQGIADLTEAWYSQGGTELMEDVNATYQELYA